MSIIMMSATGCSAKKEPTAAPDQGTVAVAWDKVNSALEKYDFGKTYYLDSDYKDEETSLGTVSIVNYDPASAKGFKEVSCQIMISYGKTATLSAGGKDYEDPMITFSFVDNKSNKSYSAVYNAQGQLAEEEGEWVLEEDKSTKLASLVQEAQKMFSLEEQ